MKKYLKNYNLRWLNDFYLLSKLGNNVNVAGLEEHRRSQVTFQALNEKTPTAV
jgi:hypothetical protein